MVSEQVPVCCRSNRFPDPELSFHLLKFPNYRRRHLQAFRRRQNHWIDLVEFVSVDHASPCSNGKQKTNATLYPACQLLKSEHHSVCRHPDRLKIN